MGIERLSTAQLYQACDPQLLDFETTADIASLEGFFGQERAQQAVRFAMQIEQDGYNLYLAGDDGMGRHALARHILGEEAKRKPEPCDWCYINNFEAPDQPLALRLPRGVGREFRHDMEAMLERLLTELPAIFQSDDFRDDLQEINDEYHEREVHLFEDLGKEAKAKGVALIRTPGGYTISPLKDGEIISPKTYEKLSDAEKKTIKENTEAINQRLEATLKEIFTWKDEHMERVKDLREQYTRQAIDPVIDRVKAAYAAHPEVLTYLDKVQVDVIENVGDFQSGDEQQARIPEHKRIFAPEFRRYHVNMLVDNSAEPAAPIVHEDNPTYQNLVGRIEHIAQFGTLLTDFTLIKPGAFHRANGGYLMLDAAKVLTSPFAWEALKRILKTRELRIESIEKVLSLGATTSLEPEPIDLDVKVILRGNHQLYFLLKAYDAEFSSLFKVWADFADTIERSADTTRAYAKLVAAVVKRNGGRSMRADAVARLIEQSARRAADNTKLSLYIEGLVDLIREADHFAGLENNEFITRDHVNRALDERIYHNSRFQEQMYEQIQRGTVLLDTSGSRVAQINGLSVLQLGNYSFGRPTRISATARLGSGKLIDIEREAELGGPIHSKGVLILGAYLATHYARNKPLALAASLVFEQSYGGVEGDSASAAELMALLSAISGVPIKQSLAITGSVNQAGEIQAIGGVNEKIEGFYEVCKLRGLSGEQGVVIPSSNLEHLMLREELIAACERQQFHIYTAETMADVIKLMTGMDAGEKDSQQLFAEDTFNGKVQAQIDEFVELGKKLLGRNSKNDDDRE